MDLTNTEQLWLTGVCMPLLDVSVIAVHVCYSFCAKKQLICKVLPLICIEMHIRGKTLDRGLFALRPRSRNISYKAEVSEEDLLYHNDQHQSFQRIFQAAIDLR